MATKREAYNSLPPESQRCFRLVCIEWAKRFADVSLDSPEAEDEFIELVLDAIENGDMIMQINGKGEDAGWSLVTTEKGKPMVQRVNAEMN